MKAATTVTTPAAYITSLDEPRRSAVKAIHDAIRKAAPKLKPLILHGIIGFGRYHYKSRSGCEGEWAVVCLASQKNYVSLYICAGDKDGYYAERNKSRLGKVSVGKSCIRFKKLEDLNLPVALELVKKAEKFINDGGLIAM